MCELLLAGARGRAIHARDQIGIWSYNLLLGVFSPPCSSSEHAQLLPILGVYYLLLHEALLCCLTNYWKKSQSAIHLWPLPYSSPPTPAKAIPQSLLMQPWPSLALQSGLNVCLPRVVGCERGSCGYKLERRSLKCTFLLALSVWKWRGGGRR